MQCPTSFHVSRCATGVAGMTGPAPEALIDRGKYVVAAVAAMLNRMDAFSSAASSRKTYPGRRRCSPHRAITTLALAPAPTTMPDQDCRPTQAPAPDATSIFSDSSTVCSRQDQTATSTKANRSLAQRLRNVLSDVGKPPTAAYDSEHGIKPKTPGTVDTMTRPPRI
ncbi:hypothetical protein PG991_004250 [Apiospora marii]|uniref:Uncharacterized protein n=1 Tax=Apiospora marii TaxID=335849 RepID=A0ABR1S7K8_9PEZI